MNDLKIAEQCIPKECKDDLVSRRQVYCLKLASESDLEFGQALMNMPSAEPEPKKGKWIRNFDGNEWHWFCSNCKEEWYEEDLWMGGNDFPNFCPNCGAKMKEGEENE